MNDIHYKGEFPSISDAWKKYPNGGGFGDYITVNGVRINWHEYTLSWGDQAELEGIVRPAEVIDHSIIVLGKGTFKDGSEFGDFIAGVSGAAINKDGDAEVRTLKADQVFLKNPDGEGMITLSEFIKKYKTELPPDWGEYEKTPLFNDVRFLIFDPQSNGKYYTTIGDLKKIFTIVGSGTGEFDIEILRSDDTELIPTDNNVFSSLKTLLEIRKAIQDISLDDKYISKIKPDTAQKIITFLEGIIVYGLSKFANVEVEGSSQFKELSRFFKGIQIGENFIPGLDGIGGLVDQYGNAELTSLILRTFLEVPELRFNRQEVYVGNSWRAAGAGIIESVDEENKIVTLKLEDGEIGAVSTDDICMGIYHSFNQEENATEDKDDSKGNMAFAGFATSYFTITNVLDSDNRRFRYALRPISEVYPRQVHPKPFMHFVSYSNWTNKDRQTCEVATRTYRRWLRNMNTWEIGVNNIAMQIGDLANLNIHGLQMEGYSAYLNNMYFTGTIHQLAEMIQQEVKVGGKNLLREYDIRFGFKYWGGSGEFIDVDIDRIISVLANNNSILTLNNGTIIEL